MGSTQDGAALPPAPGQGAADGATDATATPITTPAPSQSTDGLPGVGGTDGFGGFGKTFLTEPVGRGQANQPDDVHRVSSFLADNGIVPAPTRDADEGFLRGIEKGQEKLNDLAGGGLRVDGIAKPWGPTEMLSQRAITSGKMTASFPAPAKPASPIQVAARSGDTGEGARPVGGATKPPSPRTDNLLAGRWKPKPAPTPPTASTNPHAQPDGKDATIKKRIDALTEAGIVPKDAEWLARMDDKDYAKFLELIDSEGGSDTDNMLISAFKLISGLLGPDKNAFKDAKVAGGVR